MNATEQIGDLIKKARTAAGLTQPQLAEKIGVTQSSISLWEKGHREPALHQLRAIATALGVPIRTLIEQEAA